MMQSKLHQQDDKENNMMGNLSTHSVLNAFDFTAIDEMDPSLGKIIQLGDGNFRLLHGF